ncbi:MAG: peptidoglycan DD-metalloendopeptidase family protein [candidate division Zixibacteria bacterium]|nr:peptidoglycan DD-metalloendopeptidase family protein [candidate division Zixibacteria bacterium]MDH3935964.1 peptidoglycan DD-metalloendopeptidase family protein [candidate division Zixibacteria bacterium]MDH4035701.1 peptidoglycan DD-metalloendopeptidase family protein [candidate division Zixibacteria bacterium]
MRVTTLTVLLAVCIPVGLLSAKDQKEKIFDQRKELQQIQEEVEQGQKRLDSLKREETGVQKNVSEYDQKIVSNRKVIQRLNKKLNAIKKDIGAATEQLTQSRDDYQQTRRRFLAGVHRFYLVAHSPTAATSEAPNQEVELNRRVVYLTALADFEAGHVAAASAYLNESIEQLDDFSGEKSRVAGLKKKKETATALDKSRKERQQKKLQALRRRKTEEADHLLMLQQAAEEMEGIIARLEQQRQPPPGQTLPPSVFASMKGQLPPPVRGKIIETFGSKVHPITHLKSFSPGVTIKAAAGRKVTAVGAGTVAYVGDLRGYGKFVILDHGDRYYSTYAGLDRVAVTVGRYVHAGDQVAVAASEGRVKFELREGRQPLDPVKWIRFDAL